MEWYVAELAAGILFPRRRDWSGRGDLNSRPPAPKAGALPGCATTRRDEACDYTLCNPQAESALLCSNHSFNTARAIQPSILKTCAVSSVSTAFPDSVTLPI